MSNSKQGAPLPVQAAAGSALSVAGAFFAFALAEEADVGSSIWGLLLLATLAGLALAWLNEWVERGRSPRKLALPIMLLLGACGATLGSSLSEGNQVWIGLAAYAAGVAWVAVALVRLAAKSQQHGSPSSS